MNSKPTEIDNNGTKIWKNSEGKLHRDNDLPAVIGVSDLHVWYQNGYRCRDNDLPARIWSDGLCEWWTNGAFIKEKRCTDEQVEEYKKPYYLQKSKKNIKFDRFEKLLK